MKVQTRIGVGRRIWVCPICGWRATISTRKHFQTGQPLTREQQIGSLAVDAERHFVSQHRHVFSCGTPPARNAEAESHESDGAVGAQSPSTSAPDA